MVEIYLRKQEHDALKSFCKETKLSKSAVGQLAITSFIANNSSNPTLSGRAEVLSSILKVKKIECALKFEVKKMFFGRNARKLLAKGIEACEDMAQVRKVLEHLNELATLYDDSITLKNLANIREWITQQKSVEFIKAEMRGRITMWGDICVSK